MPYYHVRVVKKGARVAGWASDLTEQELLERYVIPYRRGESLFIRGTTVARDELARILITVLEEPFDVVQQQIIDEIRRSRVLDLTDIPMGLRVASRGRDV